MPHYLDLFFALQEVNEMWAGLGYYRRARFLLEVNPLCNSRF